MTPAQAWRRLGIAATEDQRAIRGAYATALKAIDPDAEPARFIALREARDLALWLARERASEAAWADEAEAEAYGLQAETPPANAPAPAPEPEPEPEPDPEDARLGAHANALSALLHGADAEEPLTPGEAAAAGGHAAELLADPALETIDRAADVGRWFAYLLAQTSPRSDPLLGQVADRFGWRDEAGQVGQEHAVAFVTDRLTAIEFWHTLSRPEHRLHTAWRELTRPADERSRQSLLAPRKRVRELLATVRARYPVAEQWFDPWRVSLWEEGRGPFRIGSVTQWLFVFWIAVSVLNGIFNSDRSPSVATPPPPIVVREAPLADERADVAAAIEDALGDAVTPAQLAERNPSLDALLRSNWSIYREGRNSRAEYLAAMRTLLLDRVKGRVAVPGSALALGMAEQEVAILTALLPRPDRCAAYLGGSAAAFATLPAPLRERSRTLALRLAVEGMPKATDAGRPRSTTLDGATVEAIAAKSGLPDARLRAALEGGGSAADRCRMQIAIRQVALALPPRRRDRLLAAL